MVKRQSGLIFLTNNEDYALAYYHEQLPQFKESNKLLCHIYKDVKLKEKKYDKPMLKRIENLIRVVGFLD